MKTNPSAIALILLGLAVVVYLGVISPLSGSLLKARATLTEERSHLTNVELTIAQRESFRERIAQLEKTNATSRAAWLTPMLNSYGMRAKSLLDNIATESGLTNVEYNEGKFRALPLPNGRLPVQRTARMSIRLKAVADYAAIVSFLLRAEKELPLMAVQAIAIQPTQNADLQSVEADLEWPCEGKVIR